MVSHLMEFTTLCVDQVAFISLLTIIVKHYKNLYIDFDIIYS